MAFAGPWPFLRAQGLCRFWLDWSLGHHPSCLRGPTGSVSAWLGSGHPIRANSAGHDRPLDTRYSKVARPPTASTRLPPAQAQGCRGPFLSPSITPGACFPLRRMRKLALRKGRGTCRGQSAGRLQGSAPAALGPCSSTAFSATSPSPSAPRFSQTAPTHPWADQGAEGPEREAEHASSGAPLAPDDGNY